MSRFEGIEVIVSSLTKGHRNIVFVEVCCERRSALACEAKRLGYMGIIQDMEAKSTQTAVSQYLNQYRDPKKVFVHISPLVRQGHHCGTLRDMMNQLLRILLETRFIHMRVSI